MGTHPKIQAFEANLPAIPKSANVAYYKLGEGYRGPAAQEAAFDRGASNAHYGESAHNVGGVTSGVPWKGAARDVNAILGRDIQWQGELVKTGSVSPNPADYAPMVDYATSVHGLYSLGKAKGWDYPHISIYNWRDFGPAEIVEVAEDGTVKPPSGGGIIVLILAYLGYKIGLF